MDIHRETRELYHHYNSTEFLLFHRYFIQSFESSISQKINKTFELYYWDVSMNNIDLQIIDDFHGYGIFCFHTCFQRIPYRQTYRFLVDYDSINEWISNINEIEVFAYTLEYNFLYDKFHQFKGGTFDTDNSARDPLFWLYHKYIDYLFSLWEEVHHISTLSKEYYIF